MSGVLLSTACWPNLHYFFHLLRHDLVVIEQHDTYAKQSYRNRYDLLSANGVLVLSIPVNRNNHSKTREVRISYAQRWQHQHWGSIASAYGKAPYFEHFEDLIKKTLFNRPDFLLDYNITVLNTLSQLIRRPLTMSLSTDYEQSSHHADLRDIVNMQRDYRTDPQAAPFLNKFYYQTFGDRFGFVPNLSILDLVFNAGPDTLSYLGADQRLSR